MRGDVRSRVLPADVLRLGLIGLRTRPVRAALSALGIAIGIASMVAVLGISASSAASLNAALDRLGTNLLTVTPGESILGQSAKIPRAAAPKIAHMSTVRRASAVTAVEGATVRRNPHVDAVVTNGIAVATADLSLPAAVGARLASGGFLTRASRRLPAVVLGSTAARRLGIVDAGRGATMVYVAGRWLTVVGVLAPVELAHELDAAALVGAPYARAEFGTRSNPSTIYVRAQPERVPETRSLLAGTADPEHPEQIQVSRPSDALAARAAAKSAFTALLLGLGGVALLVGGVGIANVMVISVLERRSEIGLRRAIGATRGHVAIQFVAEALLLSGLGGLAGAVGGVAATVAYSASRGWSATIPPEALAAGIGAAVAIGGVAGLYPALRAARLPPTEALRAA